MEGGFGMIKQIHIPDPFDKVMYVVDYGDDSKPYKVYPEQWLELYCQLNPYIKHNDEDCKIHLTNVNDDYNSGVLFLTVCIYKDTPTEIYARCDTRSITRFNLCTNKVFRDIIFKHPTRDIRINKEINDHGWSAALNNSNNDNLDYRYL
jgi:hypothetical protein